MPNGTWQEFVCGACGDSWRRRPARGTRPKWCPECRPKRKNVLLSKECPECGRAGVRADATFCSKRCAVRAGHWSFPGGGPVCRDLVGPVESTICELPRRHPVRLLAGRQPPPKDWWVQFVSGPCAWCGETFVVPTGGGPALYCSRSCASSAGKSRRGRFLIPPDVRQSIYARDQWLCQWEQCPRPFEPIDPTLPSSHKWAATLDHIECQSWVLVPDHSPSNLRTMHRLCNSERGDERWLKEAS